MKVNPDIINMLNARLAEEHAAYVQYTTHSSMVANNGYAKLAAYIKERAEQEREHASRFFKMIQIVKEKMGEDIDEVIVDTAAFVKK